ncbi:hypothetical protein DPMN_144616 [Dreissena polymorpha]|uniref:Uncharacterized protein n=1 Tax=Dreissena polymorpha TaxID=45954 RepID=A0A9D4IWR5_DREPO|nr:hypothetical protein DPMN_144616 [Dreissena polymorpha]
MDCEPNAVSTSLLDQHRVIHFLYPSTGRCFVTLGVRTTDKFASSLAKEPTLPVHLLDTGHG